MGRRGRPGLLGAALSGAAVFAMPWVQIRENRILTGEALRLWALPGGAAAAALLAGAALLYAALPPGRPRLRAAAALALGAGSLGALAYVSALPAFRGETLRVSVGAGCYAALAGALLMAGDAGERRAAVAAGLLTAAVLGFLLLSGRLQGLSLLKEYENRKDSFIAQTGRHLWLAASATAGAAVLGIPLALLLFSRRRLEKPVFFLVHLGQTIPTLSLLGLLMASLTWLAAQSPGLRALGVSGVGFRPAWLALWIYALFPVLNNALAGLRMVDPQVTEAARSVGMSAGQVFRRVQLPLALPLLLAGVRTAMTQSMGNAVLAALIGGGGLGSFVFLGLAQSAPDLVLLGVLPLAALTFACDAALAGAVRLARRGGPE